MTKVERLRPALRELAEQLGGSIFYMGKTWWLAPWDLQLIYERDKDGSVMSWARKLDVAEEKLRFMLESRKQPKWGYFKKRVDRMMRGLRKELIPNYRHRYYCYHRHASGDYVVLVRPFRKWRVAMRLVGRPEASGEGLTTAEAIAKMEEQLLSDEWKGLRDPPKRCGECEYWKGLKGCGHHAFFRSEPPDYASAHHGPPWCPRDDTGWRQSAEEFEKRYMQKRQQENGRQV